MKVSADVRAMIERRKKGHTLEAPFYASEEIHALDMDVIFRKHWIQVAVEPDVPEAGDYMTVELGNDSILIVRDDDMQIRAFHNVCRHRGARLCSSEKGSLGNIVCPYHSWTYNLNGDLMFAEHMGEQFDKCKHSLKKVHLENLAGLIFICLAETPPADFAVLRASMEPYLLPHGLANCKVAASIDIIEKGNWKLTMENNRECYHCVANHPELTISLYEYGFGYQRSADNEEAMAAFDKTVEERTEAMGSDEPAVEGDRSTRRPRHRLSYATPAARSQRRVADHGRQGCIDKAPGRFRASGSRRPVVLDATQLVASLHERSHRELFGDSAVGGRNARAHEVAGEQGRARRY